MSLPKIEVNPSDIQDQFENFFNEFLNQKNSDGYTFNSPIVIQLDEESDTKIFISSFFRGKNAFDDPTKILYMTYYDGCNCPHLIDEPGGRYSTFPLSKVSLSHQWLVYLQCETEFNQI